MDSSTKEVIMGDNTTSVDYSVLDSAMINIQSILNVQWHLLIRGEMEMMTMQKQYI